MAFLKKWAFSVKKTVLKIIKKTLKIIESSILCIRFPFLYPRNISTGRYHTCWKLKKKMNDIFDEQKKYSLSHIDEYVERFSEYALISCKNDIRLDDGTISYIYVKDEYVMRLAPFSKRLLYNVYKLFDRILEIVIFIPSYTRLDAVPAGWRKRFGIQMCKELKQAMIHSCGRRSVSKFTICDIKEKFGELEMDINPIIPEVERVVKKYEYISKYVCIKCGNDAVKQSLGWISPYCEDCIGNREWVWINPIYDWGDYEKEKYNKKIFDGMP